MKTRENRLQFYGADENLPFELDDDGEPLGGINLDTIRWENLERDGAKDDPDGYDYLDRYLCELFYVPETCLWAIVAYHALLPVDIKWDDYFDWDDNGPCYFVLQVVDDVWPVADKRFKHQADICGYWFTSPRVNDLSLHDSVLHIRTERRRKKLLNSIMSAKNMIQLGTYISEGDRFLSTLEVDSIQDATSSEVESCYEKYKCK